MTEESRNATLLRILSTGVASPDDWELAKYLIDKGYAKGDVLPSNIEGSVGEILDLQFHGATAAGRDFSQTLMTGIHDAQQVIRQDHEGLRSHTDHNQRWDNLPLGKLALAIGAGLILPVIKNTLDRHGITP